MGSLPTVGVMNTTYAPDVQNWLRATATALTGTDSNHIDSDLTALTDRLGRATVVGLGESTRFSVQTFGVRERIFRVLVEQHGFRALAVQDGARSGERLDRYVRGGEGTAEESLAGAWGPWRTREMANALDWIRAFNQAHPNDQVGVFGVQPPRAEQSDYDAVLDYIQRTDPDRLADMTSHLGPIRTAHEMDEHVQLHNGVHPGRPFAEHARDALALLEAEPATPERDTALAHARLILDFHENSVAGRGSFAQDEEAAATRISDHVHRTGAKVAYWDGIGHTTASAFGLGPADSGFGSPGSYLRAEFGPAYASVAIGFHHGNLGITTAPPPAPDLIDAILGTVDLSAHYVDLHSPAPESVQAWRDAPAKARSISGVYSPDKDDTAYLSVPALGAAFDVLIHIREATAVQWLA